MVTSGKTRNQSTYGPIEDGKREKTRKGGERKDSHSPRKREGPVPEGALKEGDIKQTHS